MLRILRCVVLSAAVAASLSASTVLTCSFNGGPFSGAGCYNSPALFTTSSTDWLAALGAANQPAHTVASGPWQFTDTNGVTVGLTTGPALGATDTLLRADNFTRYFDSGTGTWRPYNAPGSPYIAYAAVQSFFDAPPDVGAGFPGDHLVSTNGQPGPLEIQFSQGINGVMFRISTPTSTDVVATIAAYSQANPTAFDTPISTYSINATNAAGTCVSLGNNPPVPCNVAPYIGIEGIPGNIRSVVISTPDNAGMYIGSLYLDYDSTGIPEPGTFALFGGALIALVAAVRHRACCR